MERYIDMAPQHTRWLLEISMNGTDWTYMEDKRQADTDLSHDLVVKEDGMEARYVRLTISEVPYGAAPCISGIRVFGRGKGSKPQLATGTVSRTSSMDFTVFVENADNVTGYNILWGNSPERLYHSYLLMGSKINNKRIGALVKEKEYYVRIDSFNENGITQGIAVKLSCLKTTF